MQNYAAVTTALHAPQCPMCDAPMQASVAECELCGFSQDEGHPRISLRAVGKMASCLGAIYVASLAVILFAR